MKLLPDKKEVKQAKLYLLCKAVSLYGSIFPCRGKTKIDECFTITKKKIILWFNSADGSTHTFYTGCPVLYRQYPMIQLISGGQNEKVYYLYYLICIDQQIYLV